MKNKVLGLFDKKVDAKAAFRVAVILSLAVVVMVYPQIVAFADATGATAPGNVVTTKFQSLIDVVSGVISSLGMLVTMWGISEWGIAFQSSEGTMQAQALKRIGGGIVMSLAPQLAPVLLS